MEKGSGSAAPNEMGESDCAVTVKVRDWEWMSQVTGEELPGNEYQEACIGCGEMCCRSKDVPANLKTICVQCFWAQLPQVREVDMRVNPKVVDALKDLGFTREEILGGITDFSRRAALRMRKKEPGGQRHSFKSD